MKLTVPLVLGVDLAPSKGRVQQLLAPAMTLAVTAQARALTRKHRRCR